MKKVVLALLIIVVLAFGIAFALHSCRNGEIEPAPILAPTPTPEPTPVETPEPTPIETPEPTIDNETPNIDHELVGTWQYFDYWDDETRDIFALHADATGSYWVFNSEDGTRNSIDITWEVVDDILTIFIPGEEAWVNEYAVEGGNRLHLLSQTDGHFTLTRAE